jgi:hypothetical protein
MDATCGAHARADAGRPPTVYLGSRNSLATRGARPDAGRMRRAEYRSLLTEAYDLDKPEPLPDELAFYRVHLQRHGTPALELMSAPASTSSVSDATVGVPGRSAATSACRVAAEVTAPTSAHSGAEAISGAWK